MVIFGVIFWPIVGLSVCLSKGEEELWAMSGEEVYLMMIAARITFGISRIRSAREGG